MTPTPSSPSCVEAENLLQELRLCYWKALRHLDLREGPGGLTDRELLFLRVLRTSGPLCSRSLSKELQVTPANITRLSAGLETRRLVEKIRDPTDHRRVVLSITPQGGEALEDAARQRELKLRAWLSDLSPKEVRALTQSIHRLTDAMDDGASVVAPDPS